jgi:hypothetical protein
MKSIFFVILRHPEAALLRVTTLGTEGKDRFPSASLFKVRHHDAPVAQLDRASVYGTECWPFKPARARHGSICPELSEGPAPWP